MSVINLNLMNYSIRNDKNIYSEEVYFGKTTSLEIALENFISETRLIYDEYLSDKYSLVTKSAKKHEKIIQNMLEKYEKEIAKAVNVEKCTLGLRYGSNSSCIPMIWDDRLIDENSDKSYSVNTLNDKFAISLEDIMETSDGFKFRDAKGKHIIIVFGIGHFREGLSNKDCIGILLHEWGHCIQQLLVSINSQLYCRYKKDLIEETVKAFDFINFENIVLNPILVLTNLILALPNLIDTKIKFSKLNKMNQTKTEEEIGEIIAAKIVDSSNREAMRDEVQLITKYTIKQILKPRSFKFKDLFIWVGQVLLYFIRSISSLGYVLSRPFHIFLNAQFLVSGPHKKFLERELRYEQFADYIASAYGYSQGIMKTAVYSAKDSDETGKKMGFFDLLHFVPMINILIAYSNYQDMKTSMLLAGYPTTLERLEGIYASLDYELKTNKNLSNSDKEKIKIDMEELKGMHYDLMNQNTARNFVLRLYYKITKRSIENGSGKESMTKNVIEPLTEILKEMKERNKIDDKKLKDSSKIILENL